MVGLGVALMVLTTSAQTNQFDAASDGLTSVLLEAAGQVEYNRATTTNWQTAAAGLTLRPGDRVRTREQSRAAVQLSDRSILRLQERTTLEILPPRRAEKRRFGLPRGSIYFFNREKPAAVEFDTPIAAGAIRGTEFVLDLAESGRALRLALLDGVVALQDGETEVVAQRGEELRLAPGQPPQKTALLNVPATIQWALYYPAVLDSQDLNLETAEEAKLSAVLKRYGSGNLLGALAAWPADTSPTSPGERSLRAQLELAVGRVAEAEQLLAAVADELPSKRALAELIAVVRGQSVDQSAVSRLPASASEWLARSYALQARADLSGALGAVRQAVELAPQSGFAWARLAELEFSRGHRRAARSQLDRALALSPQLVSAHALAGFVELERGRTSAALAAFDRARELDAAFGPAWLGRGLCRLRQRDFAAARAALQAAAALEPQRSLFRSYLGKAASELGDAPAAEKEFALAKQLDANDPTAWLYSALHLWQHNRINEAIRDLETSAELNDHRAVFRSRLLLEEDRAVRSANLAALYEDAGLPDVSRHAAARAVAVSYANFSGHLFLANSLQSLEDANRFDLRLESARQSELLVANLLAPPGAGNLSQRLSQSEHLRFFDPKPIGVHSLTEYGSNGDWRQLGTVFGALDGFSYAFDASYESLNGQQPNSESERRQFVFTAKQRVTPDDEAYFQIGHHQATAEDVARRYDPAVTTPEFRVKEKQEPTLYAGWHHAWSPGSHTLLLFARLDDRLSLHDPQADVIFLRQTGGVITEVQSPPAGPPFTNDFTGDFTLYSAELQHIWETPRQSLIVGGRWQSGDVDTRATLSRALTGVVADTQANETFQRGNVHGYYSLRVVEPLRLVGGVSYDYVEYPVNADLPPLSAGEESEDLISPKFGLLFEPWQRGLLRASYTRSLGGLYFDNSVRLEPSQVAGFNQVFRSLIPESVAGLVPGTEFETAGAGFDQSWSSGTFVGVEAEWLTSDGERTVGVLTNSLFLPIPDSPGRTRQRLEFRERSLSAYAGQLLGEWVSVGARYRVSEAEFTGRFPEVPGTAANLESLEQNERAVLHQLSLTANFNHRSGVFARWESAWFHQHNSGYTPSRPGEDFWQHNVVAGYRFARRPAELRVGVLNLFDQDYRLNPLNLYPNLPRERTFVASLRLSF
ncbi:MAG: FecR domain-containing protein [Verrucomicrobia bacterium]|nr:FecR domain-containing protein [Verrucomicrobiota bacterium]